MESRVAAGGELLADEDDDAGGGDAAQDGGDGAFPGFVGAEAWRELAFAEVPADVEGGDVPAPDADHEEEDEGGTVFLLPEERPEAEGVGDVDEAEESLGGVGQDTIEGDAEAVPGEEDEGQGAEDGELGIERPVGQGGDEEKGGAGGHPPEGDAAGVGWDAGSLVDELEILIGGEFGDDGGEEGDHPGLPKEDESDDGCDEDDSSEDTFHELRLSLDQDTWLRGVATQVDEDNIVERRELEDIRDGSDFCGR